MYYNFVSHIDVTKTPFLQNHVVDDSHNTVLIILSKMSALRSLVVEYLPAVWEVVGLIPDWVIPTTLEWYFVLPYSALIIKGDISNTIVSVYPLSP